jgi:hypothetical protein
MNGYLARVVQSVLEPPRVRPIAGQRFTSRFSPEPTIPGIVSDVGGVASTLKGSAAPDPGPSSTVSPAAASVEAAGDETFERTYERREPPSREIAWSPQSPRDQAHDSSAQLVPGLARSHRNITTNAPRTDSRAATPGSSALVAPQHSALGVAQNVLSSPDMRFPTSSDRDRDTEQPVHIHIGRIDVRAVTAPAVPAAPPPRRGSASLLEAHMRARDSGKR